MTERQARYAIIGIIQNNPVLRNNMRAAGYRVKPAKRLSELQHKLVRQFTDSNPKEVEKWYKVYKDMVWEKGEE